MKLSISTTETGIILKLTGKLFKYRGNMYFATSDLLVKDIIRYSLSYKSIVINEKEGGRSNYKTCHLIPFTLVPGKTGSKFVLLFNAVTKKFIYFGYKKLI